MNLHRPRLSLRKAMVLVALAALFFGGRAANRREQIRIMRILLQDMEKHIRQVEWLEKHGTMSKEEVAAERARFEKYESEIDRLQHDNGLFSAMVLLAISGLLYGAVVFERRFLPVAPVQEPGPRSDERMRPRDASYSSAAPVQEPGPPAP